MKTKSFSSFGAFHPFLFFAIVYLIALVFSVFICSALFYSCNAEETNLSKENRMPVEKTVDMSPGLVANN